MAGQAVNVPIGAQATGIVMKTHCLLVLPIAAQSNRCDGAGRRESLPSVASQNCLKGYAVMRFDLGYAPRIDDSDRQPADVDQIAGCDFGIAAVCDTGNQDVANIAIVAGRERHLFQFAGPQPGCIIKRQNPIDQKCVDDLSPARNECVLSLSTGKARNSEFYLEARYRRGMHNRSVDAVDPAPDVRIATRVHQFGYDIGIEDDHGATGQSLKSIQRLIESPREMRAASKLPASAFQSSCARPISPKRLERAVPNGSFAGARGGGKLACDSTSSASASMVRPLHSARRRSRSTNSAGTSSMTSCVMALLGKEYLPSLAPARF